MQHGRSFSAALFSAVVAIVFGLLVGYLLLLIAHSEWAFRDLSTILTAGFGDTAKFARVLCQAVPLICTGLSFAFAFKTGLFNLGAAGQYAVGAFFALFAGIHLQLPWYWAVIASIIGGAIWGAIPGICKALFNVSEIVSSFLFSWIGVFAVNMAFQNFPMLIVNYWDKSSVTDRTPLLADANASAVLPKLGLDRLLNSNLINIGFLIAVLAAVILWILLQKTTFGYTIKACGYSRDASRYSGINVRRTIIRSFMISGALAGLGGGLCYLGGGEQYTFLNVLPAAGFIGIPVALLASSHPIGIIVSALFISGIQIGGEALQPLLISGTTDLIIGVMIYVSAFALPLQILFGKLFLRRSPATQSLPDSQGEDGENE